MPTMARLTLMGKFAALAVVAFLFIGALFFLPAGTLNYWQAWLYLGVLFFPMMVIVAYLIMRSPDLLARRMQFKEKDPTQKRVVEWSGVFLLLVFGLPGFDIRFGWSNVPAVISLVAEVCVIIGYGWIVWVFLTNRYAGRTIGVEAGQEVITTGPYAWVRHQMYLGDILMYVFSPIALGSYWAVLPAFAMVGVFILRLRNEEALLLRELPGYRAYTEQVPYRLVPNVW